MRRTLSIAAAVWALSFNALVASPPTQVTLAPMTHHEAALVIVGKDGTPKTYSPADLEDFPTYSVVTKTPWREEAAEFSGVLLSDLLEAHGLDSVQAILVTAENDYTTTLEQALLKDVPIVVATRVNGKPHTRRERGPIQFIIEETTFESSPLTSDSNFVWMAAKIEPAS